MPDFEFLGTLHRNRRQMHDAIAEEWLASAGFDTRENFQQPKCRLTADCLAADVIAGFGLHELPGFDRSELIAAFSRLGFAAAESCL